MEKICVIGLGYIGLPTASLFATKGFKVLGVDVNAKAVETINRGGIHIYEPDLDILVKSAVNSGNLRASIQVENADVYIIAVPTPFKEGHEPDLSFVEAAAHEIAKVLKPENLVILESTSPVGTTEKIAEIFRAKRPDLNVPAWGIDETPTKDHPILSQVYLAHCPERVLPGHILKELIDNDRIIGGINFASTERASELYRRLVQGELFCTDSRTAELTKLVENSYRDVNIAFANELSFICDELGVSVWDVIEYANKHPRVNILKPGPGVGGHCIAIDPWFIVSSCPKTAKLIRTAREINDSKASFVVKKVTEKASRFKTPVIACLGLSYKANIDDLRSSPAVEIVKDLAQKNIGKLLIVEPHVKTLPKELQSFGLEQVALSIALDSADIILLLVDHREFTKIRPEIIKEKIVIDTRGVYR